MMRIALSAALLSFTIGVGTAFAQAPAQAPAPAAKPAAPAMSPEKKAISKSCSDQANAKGLHGQDRKKFRSECKHNGGKAA